MGRELRRWCWHVTPSHAACVGTAPSCNRLVCPWQSCAGPVATIVAPSGWCRQPRRGLCRGDVEIFVPATMGRPGVQAAPQGVVAVRARHVEGAVGGEGRCVCCCGNTRGVGGGGGGATGKGRVGGGGGLQAVEGGRGCGRLRRMTACYRWPAARRLHHWGGVHSEWGACACVSVRFNSGRGRARW